MPDNIIRIKNPIKIRSDDDRETALHKQNENNRQIWQALNDILSRLGTQEDRNFLEYIQQTKEAITIMTPRGNRKITLNEE